MIGILLLFLPEKKYNKRNYEGVFFKRWPPEQGIIIIIFFSLLS